MKIEPQIISQFKTEILSILVVFIAFIAPIKGMFYLVGMAVFLDTFYAIYYSIKTFGIKSITSHNLFNSAVKTFFYMGTILIAYTASINITGGQLFGIQLLLPKSLCAFWLIIEFKSIDETSVKLGNKPFIQIVKGVFEFLKMFKKDLTELKK